MTIRQQDLLLLVILAAAAALHAGGQAMSQAASPASGGTQAIGSIPDFSGIWAHLSWPGIERPPEGPGPVLNTARRDGVSDTYQLVGDYTNPILKPGAARIIKQHGEISRTGVPYPTPSN
jgi:hypothetical protein